MTIRNEAVTIDVNTQDISPSAYSGGERTLITFTNISTGGQVITLSIGEQAANNAGIPLSPGGFYSESNDNNFECTQERIAAIGSIAGGILAVHERRL
jgi:hypothetical protein